MTRLSVFPAEEYAARRLRVLDRIDPESVAVVQGAPEPVGFEPFRQTNEFHYLSGIEVAHAYLLLDGRNRRSTLYLPPVDPKQAENEGPGAGGDAESVKRLSGVDEVRPREQLQEDLAGASIVFTPYSPAEGTQVCRDTATAAQKAAVADPWDDRAGREARLIEKLGSTMSEFEIRDLTPVLDALRVVKSPAEVEVMRRAGSLSAMAAAEAMRSTRPGLMEYQLAAIADYLFRVHGAKGGSYRAIVAAGRNIWYSHYWRNDCLLVDGQTILFDYAPDVDYYTSDIGRMWPVGGTYSPVQRELYGFVVEYHKALLERIRPGASADEILAEAAEAMQARIDATQFSKPEYEAAARRMLDFAGHLSHPVGMAVHDPGDYKTEPLKPGVVFALDPQMWIPEEQTYVRVEDTVAVTETGVEILTVGAPLELDDVEQLMLEPGMLGRCPASPTLAEG